MMKSFFSRHSDWPAVLAIAQQLLAKGHRVVLAGGCVRDALLGNLAQDLDIATDATPDQVGTYFNKVLFIGKNFGVCRVVEAGASIEVATFREESNYLDGRHPEEVVYSTLEKDALRRDFTINAMYFDLKSEELIDTVGGQKDIQLRRLVTVGDPVRRFGEDHLRVLRGARFAAQLGFVLESNTQGAMARFAPELKKISRERIQDEVHKTFKSQRPFVFFEVLQQTQCLDEIFTDISFKNKIEFLGKTVSVEDLLKMVLQSPVPPAVGWALLLWIRHKTKCEAGRGDDWLRGFKLSNDIVATVLEIIKAEEFFKQPDLKVFVSLVRQGQSDGIKIFWHRLSGFFQAPQGWFESWQRFESQFLIQGELPEALVKGDDLIAAGIKPGTEFKALLDEAYELQLNEPQLRKEQILKSIKN